MEIPRNVNDALQVPKWKVAILEEMKALEKNKRWEVMDLLREKKRVGRKWMFTTKHNSDGLLKQN